ncbi:hypothetical protein [Paenibacillus illinoisensis]|uniref:phosphoribosyltransferase-like protein n=1 Tax=Paenibacillus illinoisensis TaxID=59845 RepID=UPI0030164730
MEEEWKLTDQQNAQIDFLTSKLKNSVRPLEIVTWLMNFRSSERGDILNLLFLMEYVSPNEMFEAYTSNFSKLKEKLPKKTVLYINYVGKMGKSGSQMAYYATKALQKLNITHIFINDIKDLPTIVGEQTSPISLAFIDDYLGTGKSFTDYFESVSKTMDQDEFSSLKISSLSVVAIASMAAANEHIKATVPNIDIYIALTRKMAFRGGLIDNKEQLKRVRNICFEYGKLLSSTNNALGFNNSQAMITFPYGSPNNTLPIVWASKVINNNKWQPLFPRFIDEKIQNSKNYRKNTAHWIGIVRLSGYRSLFRLNSDLDNEYIGKHNFRLFAFIKLIHERKDTPIICHLLGLFDEDYNNLLEESIELTYIKKNNGVLELSKEGQKILQRVQRLVNRVYPKELEEKPLSFKTVSYNPISWRGLT